MDTNLDPVLSARQLTRRYGSRIGCKDVSLDLWPGEVLGIVGESGSGKSTLLNMLSGRLEPSAGHVHYTAADGKVLDIHSLDEAQRRRLLRTELGFVHQHPRDGLRMSVSAGANIGERLMANGARHYGNLRATALDWLERVEIPVQRVDDTPSQYSGGMQQRLQIARNLVTTLRQQFNESHRLEEEILKQLDGGPDSPFFSLLSPHHLNEHVRKWLSEYHISEKHITFHCLSHSKFFYLLNISELSILKNVTANDLETSYILFLSQLCNIQRTL